MDDETKRAQKRTKEKQTKYPWYLHGYTNSWRLVPAEEESWTSVARNVGVTPSLPLHPQTIPGIVSIAVMIVVTTSWIRPPPHLFLSPTVPLSGREK